MNDVAAIMKYAEEVHANSREHGFWNDEQSRNKAEMVMLMVSELSECLEAHRKGHRYNVDNDLVGKNQNMFFNNMFKNYCKSTLEDEIADVVIRILDFVYGWQIEITGREYRKESSGNFGNDLLRLDWYILQAFHGDIAGKDWGYALAAICKFCNWWNIDLEKHVVWKNRFNKSRPYKHNKAY